MRYYDEYKKIDGIIRNNMRALKKPNVISVRPGLKMIGGKLLDKPAIVATVNEKKDKLKPKDMLPMTLGGYMVDVREASPMQKLRMTDPESHAILKQTGPDSIDEPEHIFERSMPDGKLMAHSSPATKARISGKATDTAPYTAPMGYPLKPVSDTMTITTCASPDGGYNLLSGYLAGAKNKLTVAMYSFTSRDLVNDMVNAVKPGIEFKMVLDGPPNGTKHPQVMDADTAKMILAADHNAEINWALEKGNVSRGRIDAGSAIYPSAYHIKVAVRDSKSFWLSSGNFNVTNEPNIQPDKQLSGSYDRDWHVVVENEELAQLFEAYILNDFEVAGKSQADEATANKAKAAAAKKAAAARIKKEMAAMAKMKSMATKKNTPSKSDNFHAPVSTLGIAKVFNNASLTVQPLLTPDRGNGKTGWQYLDQILALINSAQKTLYMQFQYISAYGLDPKTLKQKNPLYMTLLDAVAAAIKRNVCVQIIASQYEVESHWLEPVMEYSKEVYEAIKIMEGVHNKGIIVDSQKVVVSSQNWSAQGVQLNRDAGVIIESPEIAAFFEAIFNQDWMYRSYYPGSKASTATAKKSPAKKAAAKKKAPAKKAASVKKRAATKKATARK